MEIVLEILFDIFTFNMMRKPTEEQIGENMTILKKTEWFQVYLQDKEYKSLIVHDGNVRKVIGRFKSQKLRKDPNHFPYQKKVHNVLLKKSGAKSI